jgi:hypothetical protein
MGILRNMIPTKSDFREAMQAVERTYQDLLFRKPDINGFANWSHNLIFGGHTEATMRARIKLGSEYRKKHPLIDPKKHRTDFLTLPLKDGSFNASSLELPGLSDAVIQQAIKKLKDRNYTHVYLYTLNGNDFRGRVRFNMYNDVSRLREVLQQFRDADISTWLWLNPDDHSAWHHDSPRRLPGIWNTFIPQVDDLVDGYVPGLECNEYWSWTDIVRLTNVLADRLSAGPMPPWSHARSSSRRGWQRSTGCSLAVSMLSPPTSTARTA